MITVYDIDGKEYAFYGTEEELMNLNHQQNRGTFYQGDCEYTATVHATPQGLFIDTEV